MPELRKDFLTEELVVIAEKRENRPQFFKPSFKEDTNTRDCPFCPENSDMTPPQLYISPCKNVRVIPNKYPAFVPEVGEYGYHEVVIDTPEHYKQMHEFSISELSEVIKAIKNRLNVYNCDRRIKYVQVIKNNGPDAGASIFHSHWQIFAIDFLPNKQNKIRENLELYSKATGRCFICDLCQDKYNGLLKITENESFVAYSPYASVYTHMVQIAPKAHISDFAHITEADGKALSSIVLTVVNALKMLNSEISYNICLQNTSYPCDNIGHFYLQIIPRIGNLAGFEFSTGCFINSAKPEDSCDALKRIIAKRQ